MEGRKLNFNAPLLSVRRFSTTSASSDGENKKIIENSPRNRRYTIPFYRKPDLNLDQVTEPATVPFLWEQIPGRPKDDSGLEHQAPKEASHASKEAPITPRLPPGRVLDVIKVPLVKELEDQIGFRPQTEACSLNDNLTRLDCSNEGLNEKEGSDFENDNDVYSDALDTLSSTDSFSLNYSVSGLSGSDGPIIKRSGTFSTDPQTRDFMLSRFLPAAKAMALAPPQYTSRKQPLALEQPREVKKVVSGDKRPPINECKSIIISHYDQDIEEEESEDEDNDCSDSGNISLKACGLFPRLCFKNSLCRLNPVLGMKVRTQASMSSTCEVGKLCKAASIESRSQSVKKNAWDAVYKHKLDCGVRSPELREIKSKLTCGSNRFTYSSDKQATNMSSPCRRSGAGNISPYRNVAPQSPFRGVGFLGIPKEAENFKTNRLNVYSKGSNKSRELLSHQSIKQRSGSVSPIFEKTLYIDTVNIAEISCSNSSSSGTKGQMDYLGEDLETSLGSLEMEETDAAKSYFQVVKCPNISKGGGKLEPEDLETSLGSMEMEETDTERSSFHDVKRVNISNEGEILGSKVSGSVYSNQSSFSDILHLSGRVDKMEGFRLDRGLDQESKSLECIKVTADGNLNISSDQILKADDSENVNAGSEPSPLPPPLPKKPSESWLWRTLPSISSQNPFLHSYLGTRLNTEKQDSKTSSTNTKWETIVKTSNSHNDHVRCSEELITHICQQSKT